MKNICHLCTVQPDIRPQQQQDVNKMHPAQIVSLAMVRDFVPTCLYFEKLFASPALAQLTFRKGHTLYHDVLLLGQNELAVGSVST
jgi:hypothetical protein